MSLPAKLQGDPGATPAARTVRPTTTTTTTTETTSHQRPTLAPAAVDVDPELAGLPKTCDDDSLGSAAAAPGDVEFSVFGKQKMQGDLSPIFKMAHLDKNAETAAKPHLGENKLPNTSGKHLFGKNGKKKHRWNKIFDFTNGNTGSARYAVRAGPAG